MSWFELFELVSTGMNWYELVSLVLSGSTGSSGLSCFRPVWLVSASFHRFQWFEPQQVEQVEQVELRLTGLTEFHWL